MTIKFPTRVRQLDDTTVEVELGTGPIFSKEICAYADKNPKAAKLLEKTADKLALPLLMAGCQIK